MSSLRADWESKTSRILGGITQLPEGLVWPRVFRAIPFGVLLSLALYGFWWSFDPSWRISTFGALTGTIAGLAMGISYGGLGGESRAMGRVETKNLGVWLVLAFVFAVFFASEEDPSLQHPPALHSSFSPSE